MKNKSENKIHLMSDYKLFSLFLSKNKHEIKHIVYDRVERI